MTPAQSADDVRGRRAQRATARLNLKYQFNFLEDGNTERTTVKLKINISVTLYAYMQCRLCQGEL